MNVIGMVYMVKVYLFTAKMKKNSFDKLIFFPKIINRHFQVEAGIYVMVKFKVNLMKGF